MTQTCEFNFNQLPVTGSWFVSGIHNTGIDDGNVATEVYGLELTALDEEGRTFRKDGSQNEHFVGYGQPVVAPGPGKIRYIVDREPENQVGSPNPRNHLGNLIVIEHASSSTDPDAVKVLFSVLAHLRPHRMKVRPGEFVEQGRPVAECGNSGSSRMPMVRYLLARSPHHSDWMQGKLVPASTPAGVLPRFMGVEVQSPSSVAGIKLIHSPVLGEVIRSSL